jgi:hypothetical protein
MLKNIEQHLIYARLLHGWQLIPKMLYYMLVQYRSNYASR